MKNKRLLICLFVLCAIVGIVSCSRKTVQDKQPTGYEELYGLIGKDRDTAFKEAGIVKILASEKVDDPRVYDINKKIKFLDDKYDLYLGFDQDDRLERIRYQLPLSLKSEERVASAEKLLKHFNSLYVKNEEGYIRATQLTKATDIHATLMAKEGIHILRESWIINSKYDYNGEKRVYEVSLSVGKNQIGEVVVTLEYTARKTVEGEGK